MGRPRSAAAEEAILRAVPILLAEQGYDEMSMDGVAARAGVGKATIYRRWPSKEALVSAALRRAQAQMPSPDTGHARDDLLQLLGGIFRVITGFGVRPEHFPKLLSSVTGTPSLMAVWWEHAIMPTRANVRRILERGQARGQVRQDLDLEAALDVLNGAIFFRMVTATIHGPPTPAVFQRLVTLVWSGLAAPPNSALASARSRRRG